MIDHDMESKSIFEIRPYTQNASSKGMSPEVSKSPTRAIVFSMRSPGKEREASRLNFSRTTSAVSM